MTIERINGPSAIGAVAGGTTTGPAASARAAMATIGGRVLAWTAASSGGAVPAAQWSVLTGGAGGGFAPNRAELARGGDVYGLRALAAEVAGHFGATPAQEGALGRAIEDFTRGVALQFNGRAGGAGMADDVAAAVNRAADGSGGDGIDGVTARIETAARMVDALNR